MAGKQARRLGPFRSCEGVDCDIDIDAGYACPSCGHGLDCDACCRFDWFYVRQYATTAFLVAFGLAFCADIATFAIMLQTPGAGEGNFIVNRLMEMGGPALALAAKVGVAAYVLWAAKAQSRDEIRWLVLGFGVLICALGAASNVVAVLGAGYASMIPPLCLITT